MSVNHATVARRLAGLERSLGTKLFERGPTGYELTASGRRALDAASAMEDAAAAFSRLDGGPAVAGLVRITATPSLADAFLIARLKPLQAMYPGLDLEVTAERALVSLPRHQADIALRFGRPKKGGILARRVANCGYGYYGTAEWRDRLAGGGPAVLVGFDEAGSQFPEARWQRQRFRGARIGIRTNYQTGQLAAARAGLGVAVLPHFLAADEPALVRLRMSQEPPTRELWLLTRNDLARAPQVRAVTTFLTDVIRREKGVFEGS
jgi:DNA-binding transcriptional LysR family regulator